jgi:hypothetical protein
MKTFRWNKYTNVVLLILMLGLIFTGIILESVLPPGSGYGYGRGSGQGQGYGWRGGRGLSDEAGDVSSDKALRPVGPKTFLSLGRHDWGEVHFGVATVFTLGIVLHFVLNWTWIRCAYFGSKKQQILPSSEPCDRTL